MDKPKSAFDFNFNLKLTKEELEYLLELATTQYEYCIKYDSKYNKKDSEKEYFLLGLTIKLRNKYLEFAEKYIKENQ
ncbi:MAG: hypothetical protein KAW56_10055 [Candidatus Marinimicrobia bacterium]|nr:hypothetical protein [Candidatus Neomarinimicrobiota bacterium]